MLPQPLQQINLENEQPKQYKYRFVEKPLEDGKVLYGIMLEEEGFTGFVYRYHTAEDGQGAQLIPPVEVGGNVTCKFKFDVLANPQNFPLEYLNGEEMVGMIGTILMDIVSRVQRECDASGIKNPLIGR